MRSPAVTMRVLQVVQKPQRRGAEIFCQQLSDKLLHLGHQVRTLYLYPFQGSNPLTIRNGDLVVGANERHFMEVIPGWNPAIVKKLMSAIHEFQPDVVQVNAARTVKYGSLAKRLDSGNWVLVYRNIGDPSVWLQGHIRKWIYRNIVIPKVNGIVAVSSRSREVLKSLYNGEHKIITIPRGLEPAAYVASADRETIRKSTATPLDAPVLIFLGSLTPEKRLDRLLRMMTQALPKCPELRLWILGDGPLRSEMQQSAAAFELTGCVSFLGAQKDVASYLQAADLLVLSSDTEGVPGVVLEAALFGVPAVAMRVGGVSDCILDGETGILVDSNQESEFCSAVLKLIVDSDARVRMGCRAKKWVLENFHMDQIASRYLDFYQELLRDRKIS